jgi:hypothetical protein
LSVRAASPRSLCGLPEGIVAAGPWADDQGALLVFALDPDGLAEVMHEDPYYERTPGVTVRSVREWTPIVGGGQPG